MDPAGVDRMQQALSLQGEFLGKLQQAVDSIADHVGSLATQVKHSDTRISDLSAQLQHMFVVHTSAPPSIPAQVITTSAPLAAAASPPEPFICHPEPYAGCVETCASFLMQCSLVFSQRPSQYVTEESKVAYVVNLLRGDARAWATALWGNNSPFLHSFPLFSEEFRLIFDHPTRKHSVSQRLLSLKQESRSAAEYSVDFRILATEAGWDSAALRSVYIHGLNDILKDELAVRDEPTDLDSLISLVIRLDNRLRERRRDKGRRVDRVPASSARPAPRPISGPSFFRSADLPLPETPAPPAGEPMQLGRAKLTPGERRRRLEAGECLYCGAKGHILSTCPIRPKTNAHP